MGLAFIASWLHRQADLAQLAKNTKVLDHNMNKAWLATSTSNMIYQWYVHLTIYILCNRYDILDSVISDIYESAMSAPGPRHLSCVSEWISWSLHGSDWNESKAIECWMKRDSSHMVFKNGFMDEGIRWTAIGMNFIWISMNLHLEPSFYKSPDFCIFPVSWKDPPWWKNTNKLGDRTMASIWPWRPKHEINSCITGADYMVILWYPVINGYTMIIWNLWL